MIIRLKTYFRLARKFQVMADSFQQDPNILDLIDVFMEVRITESFKIPEMNQRKIFGSWKHT